MKIWNLLIYFLFFLLGFIGIWGFYYYQNIDKKNKKTINLPNAPFKLVPPSQAISGNLKNIKGKIYKKSRGEEDFQLLKNKLNIIEGESLKNESDSSAEIMFKGVGRISLQPNSQIILTNLNPKNFIITQEQGSARYENDNSEITISIRVDKVLYQINKGEGLIDYGFAEGNIEVEQTVGSGKMAWVDENNDTRVKDLNKGEKLVFD